MTRRAAAMALLLTALAALTPAPPAPADEPPPLRVGSKKFTESVLLGEMAADLLREAGLPAEHRRELGGTQVLWQALLAGDIDVYPEYTGTLRTDIFREGGDLAALAAARGARLGRPLGFRNSYALGMRADEARRRGIRRISDLQSHDDLRYGFSEEFRNRPDGWRPLQRHYGLRVPDDRVRVLDHDLAVQALARGELDVADVYTTEGALRTFDLLALEDDRAFFPPYDAVWVTRADLPPAAVAALARLEGRVTEADMVALNARAEAREPEGVLAAGFLTDRLGLHVEAREESWTSALLRRTRQHLFLVGVSLGAAVLVALPLGIAAARRPFLGQVLLAATSVLQTIPSLALLMFLIPLFGLGPRPAIVALFLYSLLPIVRNTYAGLTGIPLALRESAQALGLSPAASLAKVELPLASRSILAGIKTAAVINVGTATLGALIDAGGYGQPILSGIRLRDMALILQGAVPAAVMALAVQGLFELAERTLLPRGLRL